MRARSLLALALALPLTLAACAEGSSTDDAEPDTSTATGTTSTTGTDDAEDVATSGDTSTGGDIEDTVQDTAPPMVCEPTQMPECLDESTVRACSPDGTAFEDTACTATQICAAGECVEREMVCEPNATRCVNTMTAGECSADGFEETETPCTGGLCVAGACSTGSPTGERCATGADCAGGVCKCGDGACPGTPLEEGYCTNQGCDTTGCGNGEFCINFGLGANTGANECILDCNRNCSRAGFGCVALPSGEGAGQSWEDVCFQADFPKPVGATCADDTECAGGLCLTEDSSGDVVEQGYCSAPCDTQDGCPEGASCVVYAGFNGDAGFCVLDCIDDPDGSGKICPPERPETIDTTCLFGTIPEGGTSQICWQQ